MNPLTRASFGMQCFWGAEALFGSINGVQTTRVGYSGGTSQNPSYRNLKDHVETVDIEFDSNRVSYEDLLEIFFKSHDPTVRYKRQYISAIFFHNEIQENCIKQFIKQRQSQFSKQIVTQLICFKDFTNAEDYHQKYFLRKYGSILRELNLNNEEIIVSPISCRLNGFCAGFGKLEDLDEEIKNLNLSEENVNILRNLIKQGPNLHECGI